MIKANVYIDHYGWQKKLKDPKKYVNKKIKKASKILGPKNKEFSILLTSNLKMKKLNNKFRKINKPTDVLSFPIKEKSYIGDVAISFEIINKRSKLNSFEHEFDKIWIHGYLHLLGYDHKKIKDYNKMRKREELIFNYLNKKI